MRLYAAACSALQGPGTRFVCILALLVSRLNPSGLRNKFECFLELMTT